MWPSRDHNQYLKATLFQFDYIACTHDANVPKTQIEKLVIDQTAIQAYVLSDDEDHKHFAPKKGA